MDSPISFASSQVLGRYLQSLDSVRFAEADRDASKIHAQVETFISLLFGQTIPIGEHQFLDFEGFLSSAKSLIDSLDSLEDRDHERVIKMFPFRLGIRSMYRNVDDLIAKKLSDVGYKLSGWHRLGQIDDEEMNERRLKIKDRFLAGLYPFEQI